MDVVLLIVVIELEESLKVICALIILHTESMIIFSRHAVFVGGSLTIFAQLFNSLRINVIADEIVTIVTSVHEVVMSAQLTTILILNGYIMELAGVDTILHYLEVFVLSRACVLALFMSSDVILPSAPVFTQVAALPLAI